MSAKNLIELENGACKVKIKPSQVEIFVEDTQVEPLSQTSDNSVFESENLIISVSQENKDIQITSILHSDNKETPKRPPKNTDDVSSHSSISFQNTFKKEMESFETFTQSVERKFEELEEITLGMSTKDKQSPRGEPDLFTELLKNRTSVLEKQLIDKDTIIRILPQKSITSSSPERQFGNEQEHHSNKDDECTSNARNTKVSSMQDSAMSHTANQKTPSQPHQQIKVTVTGDSKLNGISEKGLSRTRNIKVTEYPSGTSDKLLKNLMTSLKINPTISSFTLKPTI